MTAFGDWARRHRTSIMAAILLIILLLGLAALYRLTREVHLSDLRAAIGAIPVADILLSLAFAATSYLALTFYDYIALKVIGLRLPWRTAAVASFSSYALSNNLSFGWLTGGSARYRVYTTAGLNGPDIARVIAIATATFWMGIVVIAGAAFALHRGPVAIGSWSLPSAVTQAIGFAFLVAGAGFLILCATGRRKVRVLGWALPLPSGRQAAAQFAVAALDLAASGAALFVLISGADLTAMPSFLIAYAIALVVALVSHVPGGVGVFEAVLIALFPGDKPALFAALIVYRLIYYILPLGLGIILLALHEGAREHAKANRAIHMLGSAVRSVAPLAMAISAFAGGAILLFSGALPAIPSRLRTLDTLVPLPFIEASHIAASLAGTALLLLAPALLRRLDGAFIATRALLLAGALFSLAKGIDYEEATLCLVIAALLQWSRPAFNRRTALTAEPLSAPWLAGAIALIAAAVWLGLFAFKHVAYRDQLWWQFALDADAPRFLRASLAAAVLVAVFAGWRLLAPGRVAATPFVTDIGRIRSALGAARNTDAMLALTGDKRFLLSAEQDAFLMYQIRGSTWIVMADPIGPRERWADLLWELRDMADAAQGRLLLYQIGPDMLELVVELGLQVIKYGEEAIVELADFSLDGSAMRGLRQATNRAERAGLTFEVVPATQVPGMLSSLEAVSSAWLSAKGHAEKGFSLGHFDPGYLAQFDCAIVRRGTDILAFANIWTTSDLGEASIDLMRHDTDAPSGTMDYLFVRLMRWAKAKGFKTFSLGLAPLSGIPSGALAPGWAKLATLLFDHGERFYGFRGLRAYKAKFQPTWRPRYIAGPKGLALLAAILDLNSLIGSPAGEVERRHESNDTGETNDLPDCERSSSPPEEITVRSRSVPS